MGSTEEKGKESSPSSASEGGGVDRGMVMYKTKTVQFLGRSTPIILQNENGPCPLLAICNVLLLRNAISLNPDAYEVSQEQLLALVANRLLESNSDVKTKDEEYVNNQHQNISDAIDLLPRLATGIDVNLHFRKINDFEFTRECAIFDLLDIGLYHGWIVDPEDKETAAAIGSKSYNTLVGELVALETSPSDDKTNLPEDDFIDFVAATAATLGIPHPSLLACRSFNDSPDAVLSENVERKGDLEEEAELMRALKLSSLDTPEPANEVFAQDATDINLSSDLDEGRHCKASDSSVTESLSMKPVDEFEDIHKPNLFNSHENSSSTLELDGAFLGDKMENNIQSSWNAASGEHFDQPVFERSGHPLTSSEVIGTKVVVEDECTSVLTPSNEEPTAGYINESQLNNEQLAQCPYESSLLNNFSSENSSNPVDSSLVGDLTEFSFQPIPTVQFDPAGVAGDVEDVLHDNASNPESTEPIYEGEECIVDSGYSTYESREPVYEGEVVLADQISRISDDDISQNRSISSNITTKEGELISNFLRVNASQLTIYGLFCLLDGLNERELCVFFRNNHFSTMFKFKKELYLLATDQGYINQPDLVWEKLNEVNGDTVFMTGEFTEFRVDNQVDGTWDRENAMSSTADYLSTIKASSQEGTPINADLQLAIALQEQEFEHQPQPQPQSQPPPQHTQHTQQPSSGNGRSRLIVGPQVPRTAPPNQQRQESKAKEKCVMM